MEESATEGRLALLISCFDQICDRFYPIPFKNCEKPDISRKIRRLEKIRSGILQTVSTLVTALLRRQAEISLLSLQIGRLSEVLPIPILVGISAADAPLPRGIFRKQIMGAARIRSFWWFW